MRCSAVAGVLSPVLACLVGCSGPGFEGEEYVGEDENVSSIEQEIWGGWGEVNEPGVLRFGVPGRDRGKPSCSGSVLSPNKALSAAHCFGTSSGWYQIWAEAESSSGTLYCVTASTTKLGACGDSNWKWAWIEIPNEYPGNKGYDIAGITMWNGNLGYPANQGDARWGISLEQNYEGSTYNAYGWGLNGYVDSAGKLRGGPLKVYGVHPNHMWSKAYGTRLCQGDSGGPWSFVSGGVRLITGVNRDINANSASCFASGQCCAAKGDKQRATRVKDKQAWLANEAFPGACTAVYTPAGHLYYSCD